MLETLTGIALFQELSPSQLELLEPIFEYISCPSDTQIFEQGERTNFLYVLLKGTVIIKYKPYDGPPINVSRLRKGDVFGWSAVIGSKYYTSGTLSASRVEMIRIASRDLWKLIRQHPETGRIILDRLAMVVSSRWENAHTQVQALFDEGMAKSRKEGDK